MRQLITAHARLSTQRNIRRRQILFSIMPVTGRATVRILLLNVFGQGSVAVGQSDVSNHRVYDIRVVRRRRRRFSGLGKRHKFLELCHKFLRIRVGGYPWCGGGKSISQLKPGGIIQTRQQSAKRHGGCVRPQPGAR